VSSLQLYLDQNPMLLINDIGRQNRSLAGEISAAISRVVDRGWYILGPEVQAFEREFAGYCEAGDCVSTGNGTDALEIALRAIGIGPGDRVATVANAGMYAATAILQIGATPVFVDVDPMTMLMTEANLRAAGDVKAAVVTHLYGRIADMPALLNCGVPLIEDCAQAHGARIRGVAACFSFYPTKNLGALGDGGAVVTNDPVAADRLRSLRQYGWTRKYVSEIAGGRNSRLDEIQAAILRAKLPHLDSWNEQRRRIAARYDEAFGRQTPAPADYVAHLYVLRRPDRDRLRKRLAERGIATEVHYPIPDHKQKAIDSQARLPITEQLCSEVLSLPLFPEMTDEEVHSVIETVGEWDES
jgi:dTDP-3-amino-2,3,6-trideoxy-4-keto-D-glucose/dTDP-3-amino-3,4,6-trideoxy-alpha-D-glucose/dTDP-2,6-dideoxy-D-kanosamine transaminase